MFPIPLRSSKSERSLRKLKKGGSNLTWSSKFNKAPFVKPDLDFPAFHCELSREDVPPLEAPTSARARSISIRISKRDTILIDLTNNDLRPALDYAFAILDADDLSTCPSPSSPPPKTLFSGSSSRSSNIPCTPSSIRSTPPRYICVASPLSSSSGHSSLSSMRSLPQKCNATPAIPDDEPFDPHELSRALSHAQADSSHETTSSPDTPSSPSVPFPPPATPPTARVPLLQRKPRLLHSAESSIDGHEPFMSRNYHSPSKVSLARSVSSLDHSRDIFGSRGAYSSSTSVNTLDSGLAALLSQQPRSSSLKLFPSPKKSRPVPLRRASTPPPSRGRLGLPPGRPPVPALPDIFLLGPAARRAAGSDSNSFLSRSLK